jgi:hypothetical protein
VVKHVAALLPHRPMVVAQYFERLCRNICACAADPLNGQLPQDNSAFPIAQL